MEKQAGGQVISCEIKIQGWLTGKSISIDSTDMSIIGIEHIDFRIVEADVVEAGSKPRAVDPLTRPTGAHLQVHRHCDEHLLVNGLWDINWVLLARQRTESGGESGSRIGVVVGGKD